MNAAAKMSREVRQAEPIHVTKKNLVIAALGFLLWGIGYLLLWASPTGTRLEWILCVVGPLLLAVAVLMHLDHHRRRFGMPALVLLNIAIVLAALVFVPSAYDPALRGSYVLFNYAVWGASWLVGSLGVFLVLARKEARLEHGDKSAETEIHASFFQLTMLAVGMLIYGLSFIGLGLDRTSHFMGWLSVIGPALIAIAVIAHVEHLALRIGMPAVVLTIVGAAAWALKNVPRAVSDLYSDRAWSLLLIYGVQGAILVVGALACLLVILHKQAWVGEDTR